MVLDFRSAGCLAMGVAIGLSLAKVFDISSGGSDAIMARSEKSYHADSMHIGTVDDERSGIITAKHLADFVEEYNTSKRSTNKPPINFLEEYIPSNLLDTKYHQDNFTFPVTKSMLRQSRPVIGNLQRLHAYIQKLKTKKCTITLVLGGSVSKGHNVDGGAKNAYPRNFMEWLDGRYPCTRKDGTPGTHEYKTTHAQNSQNYFTGWSTVDAIERFDLVIFEFNINDHFLSELPHALEDKGKTGETEEYISLWYFEVLIRRILLVRKPDPPAIITFNADYIGRQWAPPPHADPSTARKTLFYYNQEPMKIWLSSLYEIPVFSASLWMLPLASKRGRDLQFGQRKMETTFHNSTNPYSTDNYHADRCCHPRKEGHLILGLVLAYCLVEEEKLMASYDETRIAHVENDFTALDTPILRDPVYLSPEEEDLYVRHNVKSVNVDFTDPSDEGKKSWKDKVVANEGWSWYADNKDKDKFGFIANNVTGGQHIALSLRGGQHGRVELSYVVSYENFGIALAWLDESTDMNKKMKNDKKNPKKFKDQCRTSIKKRMAKLKYSEHQHLVASWEEKASVPKVQILEEALDENKTMILHICLTPRSEELAVGKENKFKLLGVRVY